MERFIIEGGKQLHGTVRPNGSKNEALPVLAACLLTSEPVMLKNLPRIADVEVMLEVLKSLHVFFREFPGDLWTHQRVQYSSWPGAALELVDEVAELVEDPHDRSQFRSVLGWGHLPYGIEVALRGFDPAVVDSEPVELLALVPNVNLLWVQCYPSRLAHLEE